METKNDIKRKAKKKKHIDLISGVIGNLIVTNQKENLDFKTGKSKEKKRKRKEQDNLLVKSNKKQGITIDLISDNDDELEESQKLNSNSTCFCPVSQVPDKKIKGTLKSPKKKIYNTGASSVVEKGKREFVINNKNTTENKSLQIELSSDGRDSGVGGCCMIVLSDDESENAMKDVKVSWEGYSPLHRIRDGKRPDEIIRLAKLGYVRNVGKWTPEEEEQLRKNLEEFLDANMVKDFKGLISVRTKDDRKLRKQTQFVLKMCKGISRTGADVNSKIFSKFSKSFLDSGRFSANELQEFKSLYAVNGNDWKQIGMILNRNHRSMQSTFHECQEWNKGDWSFEEEKVLLSLVIDFKEKNKTVSWSAVSDKMKTRSQNQCRLRWKRHHSHITTKFAFERWLSNLKKDDSSLIDLTLNDDEMFKLITLIFEANIDDEFLIDWDDLMKHFDNVPSPAWLKLKFQAVCKEVPQSHRLEFTELIEQLMDIFEKKDYDNDDVQIVE